MARILSLDIGDSRIGVAMSDPIGILASPLTIIRRRDDDTDVQAIAHLVTEHSVGRVIVGLPISMSGQMGTQAEKVKVFAERLAQSLSVPIQLYDERLSTVTARQLMHEAAGKKKIGHKKDDAIAAAVILRSFLDESRPEAQTP